MTLPYFRYKRVLVHRPTKQGLRRLQLPPYLRLYRVLVHRPTKQGLRLGSPGIDCSLAVSTSPSSNKTRIKTLLTCCYCCISSRVLVHRPTKQGLRHVFRFAKGKVIAVLVHRPTKQGLRLAPLRITLRACGCTSPSSNKTRIKTSLTFNIRTIFLSTSPSSNKTRIKTYYHKLQ